MLTSWGWLHGGIDCDGSNISYQLKVLNELNTHLPTYPQHSIYLTHPTHLSHLRIQHPSISTTLSTPPYC